MVLRNNKIILCCLLSCVIFLHTTFLQAEEAQNNSAMPSFGFDEGVGSQEGGQSPVELNGDVIEYSVDGNKLTAKGDVVVVHPTATLTCDRVEFFRDTQIAYAYGNVRLRRTEGEKIEILGEELAVNFGNMKGNFQNANLIADPYYGFGEEVNKIDDNHIEMKRNYITTCDLDKPHYRLFSKKMDMYPGEKLVARHVRMMVGKVPLFYLPRFTQDLREKEPRVIFTPGYDKEWGMFLLSAWRYKFHENFKGTVHLDAREKKDIAWGFDLNYKVPDMGKGKVRTYYMNERSITSKRFYKVRPSPTIEKERFRVEWRHKWEIDSKTDTILQYSKISDSTFRKDYFEKENDKDFSPATYFLLTRRLPLGTFSFRTDARVNRFESMVERLPEVRFDLSNVKLGETDFYIQNVTTYSNLTKKSAAPSEVRPNTMRLDADNKLSYARKVGFLEFNPFVGVQNTYYSKTKDPEKYGSIRGVFKTGGSLSTKFYKVFDTSIKRWGMDINRLRHIITPTVSHSFVHEPSLASIDVDSFDGVDSLDNSHVVNFSFENKLQTKRNQKSVDLLRAVIGTDFRLKEDPGKGGFGIIKTDIDFDPIDKVKFYFDATYDTLEEYLTAANFDIYINGGERWTLDIGKRWSREVDDQLTARWSYLINPKWAFRTHTRFDLRSGILKEQEFTVTRDLHAWELDLSFNETRRQGSEIWMVFTLKAFPDMKIDFGSSFNKRKLNSQSSEGSW